MLLSYRQLTAVILTFEDGSEQIISIPQDTGFYRVKRNYTQDENGKVEDVFIEHEVYWVERVEQ